MIKVDKAEVARAYNAFRRMNEENRWGQDPAWKIATRLRKMRPIVEQFEEVQLKIYKDAGFEPSGRGMQLVLKERGPDETPAAYEERRVAYVATTNKVNDEIRELGKGEVEVDGDPIPRSLFVDPPNTPDDKKLRLSPNDLADAWAFISET